MQRRRAFTVIELIVVIAIVAILIALLLPAIQAARGAAMKNSSRNNMKQLGLALQNHADSYKTFPPLYFSSNPEAKGNLDVAAVTDQYPWTVRLLPFIEEDMLYKTISTGSTKFTQPADKLTIGVAGNQVSPGTIDLSCFKSPSAKAQAVGTTNYIALPATKQSLLKTEGAFAAGANQQKWVLPPDGMLIPDKLSRGQSMARMADGTSKTVILCESREEARSNWYHNQQTFACGFLPGDAVAVTEGEPAVYPFFDTTGTFVTNPKGEARTALDFGPTPTDPKQAYNADENDPLRRTWGPSAGRRQQIVIHAMGDGSVQEISASCDPEAYFAAITCRGGENFTPPW